MTFDDYKLNNSIKKALADLKISVPTVIQERVFSKIMAGKDVVGIAQTGTGKTYAYLLPCLNRWKYSKDRSPQTLIVVPTRELVAQVVAEIEKLTTYMNLKVVGIYGGTNINTQKLQVMDGLDVLVATPGRLMDLNLHGALKLKNVKTLVIDEVDEMLNLGFRPQLLNVLDLLPVKRQNLLFSATITTEVEGLFDTFFNTPIKVEAAPTGTPLKNINQSKYALPNFNTKVNFLTLQLEAHEEMSKVLVFVSKKKLADVIQERLGEKYPEKVGIIHSNKSQNFRFNSVKSFHDGTYRVLIATDVVARGIDISEVTHVFNFDVPEVPENYMHRIGRTGRADKKGNAITLFTEKEGVLLEAIETLMKFEVPLMDNPEKLEVSEVLIEAEKEVFKMPNMNHKARWARAPNSGAGYHEKKKSNMKDFKKVRYVDQMKLKYGKPKKRGSKK